MRLLTPHYSKLAAAFSSVRQGEQFDKEMYFSACERVGKLLATFLHDAFDNDRDVVEFIRLSYHTEETNIVFLPEQYLRSQSKDHSPFEHDQEYDLTKTGVLWQLILDLLGEGGKYNNEHSLNTFRKTLKFSGIDILHCQLLKASETDLALVPELSTEQMYLRLEFTILDNLENLITDPEMNGEATYVPDA